MCREVFVLALVLATASSASAQSITDARRVEFTPSTDHNAVDSATGVALVQNYSLQLFLAGGATPLQTVSLGKPAPQGDGMIRLDFVGLLPTPLTPGLIYEVVVAAVGPGGSSASGRSNTFGFSLPCAPSISPTSQSIAAGGGTGSSTVSVGAGCLWTAVSHAGWITVNSGGSSAGPGTATFTVGANSATTSRTGTLTIAGSTFTVTQAGMPCVSTIAPASANMAWTAGSGTVAVTSGCGWSASSNAAWITVSAGATGNGNGSVTFNVTENPATSPRTGTLTVGDDTFTITQAGAPCAPTIAPLSASVAASASTRTVSVTAATGCAWTATESATWITISAGANGSGDGSVTYNVTANPATTSRSGTLTIGGHAFAVTQAGAPCAPTISSASASAPTAGTTGTVTVTAASGCGWTATSNAAWITITAGATGSGTSSVSYDVDANPGTNGRTGTLTIGGHTFTVTQAGAPCVSTIAPASTNKTWGAGSGTVAVSAGCAWTATSHATWITISGGASGNGDGLVTFNVTANPTTSVRTGTVTIGDDTFTVTQAGAPCAPVIAPLSASVGASASTRTVTVTAATGCAWTATDAATWITISAGGTGSGNGSVTYNVAANTGAVARTGTLTIGGNSFTVNQAAASCSYTIAPGNASLSANGGSGVVSVETGAGCSWSATSGASWVTITSGASDTGSGTVGFTAARNTTSAARTATLTIAGRTFTVTEPSAACSFSVTPLLAIVPPDGVTGPITVTTQSSCAWTSSSPASWITVTATGSGSGTGSYTVPANTGTLTRSATINVAGKSITMIQNPSTAPAAIAPPSNVRIVK